MPVLCLDSCWTKYSFLLKLNGGPGATVVKAKFASLWRAVSKPNLVPGFTASDFAGHHGGPNQVLFRVVFTVHDVAVDYQCPLLFVRNDVHAECSNGNWRVLDSKRRLAKQ